VPILCLLGIASTSGAAASAEERLSRNEIATMVNRALDEASECLSRTGDATERIGFVKEMFCEPLQFMSDKLLTKRGADWYVQSVLKTLGTGAMLHYPRETLVHYRTAFVEGARKYMAQSYVPPPQRERRKRHILMFLTGFADMAMRALADGHFVAASEADSSELRRRVWSYVEHTAVMYQHNCDVIFVQKTVAEFDNVVCPGADEEKYLRAVLVPRQEGLPPADVPRVAMEIAVIGMSNDVMYVRAGESFDDVVQKRKAGGTLKMLSRQ
jgi:hypothetical protein